MALKPIRSILTLSFIVVLFATFLPVESVRALSGARLQTGDLPPLHVFVSQVKNGEAGELRGVYVPELFAARIVQQPGGNLEFVSPRQNIVTQFDLAAQVGSTGLLAHNYLMGENFSLLKKDQKFYLIFGDGQVLTYVVTEILRYQAFEPASISSSFVSLADNDLLTASELFTKVYDRPGNVIFQTCISRDGSLGWGRLFVIAELSAPQP